jgi:hypothetical protein
MNYNLTEYVSPVTELGGGSNSRAPIGEQHFINVDGQFYSNCFGYDEIDGTVFEPLVGKYYINNPTMAILLLNLALYQKERNVYLLPWALGFNSMYYMNPFSVDNIMMDFNKEIEELETREVRTPDAHIRSLLLKHIWLVNLMYFSRMDDLPSCYRSNKIVQQLHRIHGNMIKIDDEATAVKQQSLREASDSINQIVSNNHKVSSSLNGNNGEATNSDDVYSNWKAKKPSKHNLVNKQLRKETEEVLITKKFINYYWTTEILIQMVGDRDIKFATTGIYTAIKCTPKNYVFLKDKLLVRFSQCPLPLTYERLDPLVELNHQVPIVTDHGTKFTYQGRDYLSKCFYNALGVSELPAFALNDEPTDICLETTAENAPLIKFLNEKRLNCHVLYESNGNSYVIQLGDAYDQPRFLSYKNGHYQRITYKHETQRNVDQTTKITIPEPNKEVSMPEKEILMPTKVVEESGKQEAVQAEKPTRTDEQTLADLSKFFNVKKLPHPESGVVNMSRIPYHRAQKVLKAFLEKRLHEGQVDDLCGMPIIVPVPTTYFMESGIIVNKTNYNNAMKEREDPYKWESSSTKHECRFFPYPKGGQMYRYLIKWEAANKEQIQRVRWHLMRTHRKALIQGFSSHYAYLLKVRTFIKLYKCYFITKRIEFQTSKRCFKEVPFRPISILPIEFVAKSYFSHNAVPGVVMKDVRPDTHAHGDLKHKDIRPVEVTFEHTIIKQFGPFKWRKTLTSKRLASLELATQLSSATNTGINDDYSTVVSRMERHMRNDVNVNINKEQQRENNISQNSMHLALAYYGSKNLEQRKENATFGFKNPAFSGVPYLN